MKVEVELFWPGGANAGADEKIRTDTERGRMAPIVVGWKPLVTREDQHWRR